MDGEAVLVVDDVPDVRELLSYTLEVEGYRVLQAGDGNEALELAATHEPAVIVMDVQMPIMDGVEATRRLKGQGKLRHIPVIAYTAFKTDLPSHDLFDAVLPKPCSIDDVLSAVARTRAGAKSRDKARPHGGKPA
jgi:two-component system cell cycle response regulator DivK